MTYYVILQEQSILIVPRWKIKLSEDYLTDEEYVTEAALLALNGKFYIPLSKLKIDRVPHKVTILYGKVKYDRLEDLVNDIYNSRTYNIDKESAMKRINGLTIKAILNKKKLYGNEISYEFDFIDASNYEIKI